MLDQDNASDYMPSVAVSNRSVTADSMVGRQMQEVKAMVFMAKQFPRDIAGSYQRIMTACERRLLAENAAYQYPRGSEKVSGPSIRLAEVIAQNWGNIDFGVVELEQKSGESTAMSYCWDLETNVRQTKIFTVKHERHTKKGVNKLTDPRDIYEMVANQGARRLRACILGVIPGDIVDKALQKCQQTLIGNNKEPLIDRLTVVLAQYDKEFSVSKEMIEKYFGYSLTAFTEHDLVQLKKIGLSIRDGMSKREDYFDIKKTEAKESASKTVDDFEEYLKSTQKDGGTDDPNQSELPLD
jgi:hypothetical protein